MRITIDPNEMAAASETLHNCAAEAADIGSQLSSSAACPMPADVQSVVDQVVLTVDRALDEVAARLDAQAADLGRRADIAAGDSLAAAGVVVGDTGISAASGGPSVDGWSVDSAGWMAPMTTETSNSGGFSVETGSWTDPMSVDPSEYGGFPAITGSWTDSMSAGGSGSGGFPSYTGSWVDSMSAGAVSSPDVFQPFDKASFMKPVTGALPFINTITSGSNSNRIAMDLGAMGGDLSARLYTPTRADLQAQYGYALTDGQIKMFYPETLDSPNSQISL